MGFTPLAHERPLSVRLLKTPLTGGRLLSAGSCAALTAGEKQGLETVAETARALTDHHHIHFIFCGDGGARRRLYQKNYASSSRVSLAACLNVVREIFPAQAPAWYTHRTQVCCPTHSSARSGFLGRSARAGRATERRPQRLTFRRLQLPGRKNGPGATASLRDFWWPMPNTSPFRTTALM